MSYRERLKQKRVKKKPEMVIDPVSFICIPEDQVFIAPRSIKLKEGLLSSKEAYVILEHIDGQVQEVTALEDIGLARGDSLKVIGGSLTGMIALCR